MEQQRRSVALVDIDEPYASALERGASERGFVPLHTVTPPGAPRGDHRPSLVVIQACGDGLGCLEALRAIRKTLPGTPCVVLSDAWRARSLPDILGAGAQDVVVTVAAAREVAEACLDHALPEAWSAADDLWGESASIHVLRARIVAAARQPSTVLVTGETGTGKGLASRLLHACSDRDGEPFVHVDCAALAPTLIESELFGHERGAFTGATHLRIGRCEQAGRGTILLDESGELSLELQAKFLRVLEERSFERVGGTSRHEASARVIAATHRDLEAEVKAGRFRRDLLYRLRVIQLSMPPLRDRLEDVPHLVSLGLEHLCRTLHRATPAVGASFHERLRRHTWPGNIRELMHVLEAVLAGTRSPKLEHFHLEGLLETRHGLATAEPHAEPQAASSLHTARTDDEGARQELAELLVATGGNVARVARRLGLPRSTVRYRIRRYRLEALVPRD